MLRLKSFTSPSKCCIKADQNRKDLYDQSERQRNKLSRREQIR